MICRTVYLVVACENDVARLFKTTIKNAQKRRYAATEFVVVGAVDGHFVLDGLVGIILVNDGDLIVQSAMPDNWIVRWARRHIENVKTVDFVAAYVKEQREAAMYDADDVDFITDEWIAGALQSKPGVSQLLIDEMKKRYSAAVRRGAFAIGRFIFEMLKRKIGG